MKVYNKDDQEIYLNSYDDLKGEVMFYLPGKIGYDQVEGVIYLGLITGIKQFSISGATVRYENNSINISNGDISSTRLSLKNGFLIFTCNHIKKLNEWHSAIIELRCNII